MTARKTLIDYIAPEDYERYEQLLAQAQEIKDNTPRKTAPRGPMTLEQKKKLAEGRLAKAKAALEALLASEE